MFKKTFLTALLFSMLTVSSIAEETPNMAEMEELSPIAQCDEQYDKCTEKCNGSASNTCIEQCDAIADKCYDISTSETHEVPPVDNEEESAPEAGSEKVSPAAE